MSKRGSQEMLKIVVGAFACPFMTIVFAQATGFNLCTGFFGLMAIACWVILFLRFRRVVGIIGASLPQRPRITPLSDEHQPLPAASEAPDDSRSIFL